MNSAYLILLVFILVQNVWTEPIYYGKITGETKLIKVKGKPKLISINNGEYPFIVGLVRKSDNYLFCGSALISERVLLSAAHCFINKKPEEVKARFGSFMRSGDDDHLKFKEVLDFIPHNDFKCKAPEPREFDIALVVLKESIKLNKYIKIIPMIDRETRNEFYRKRANIIGWGYMEKHMASFHLRNASPWILSKKDCKPLMYRDTKLTDNMICSLGGFAEETNKPSPGSGDSGGPLFIKKGEKYQLAGVVSFSTTIPNSEGIVKTDTNYPTVYTDVAELKDWVNNKIKTDVQTLVKALQSKKPKKLKKPKCFSSK